MATFTQCLDELSASEEMQYEMSSSSISILQVYSEDSPIVVTALDKLDKAIIERASSELPSKLCRIIL